jgi:hypothetical protein
MRAGPIRCNGRINALRTLMTGGQYTFALKGDWRVISFAPSRGGPSYSGTKARSRHALRQSEQRSCSGI